MTENIKIRRGASGDAEMLRDLAYKTFWDAFAEHPKNAPDDLAAYMEKAFSLETIRAELDEKDSIFLIAEIAGAPAGYAKLMIGNTEDGISAERPCELNRLYSHQQFLGRGVGAALMDECFRIARENACDAMWLGVWEFNPRAQAFYRKYGFREVGRHIDGIDKLDIEFLQPGGSHGTRARGIK